MDAQQHACAVVDGVAVIVDMGAVGGADFAQDGAGALHDFGDAEAVADFNQFAARDDGFASGGEFVEDEEERGGVVVDDDGGFAEDGFEERAGVDVAFAARAGGEVVFEIAVAVWSSEGARPRLVWRTTPVALMTRRREGRRQGLRSSRRWWFRALPAAVSTVRGGAMRASVEGARVSRRPVRGGGGRGRRLTEGRSRRVTLRCYTGEFGAWLSLVERLVRDQEAGGSNPLAPTIFFNNSRSVSPPRSLILPKELT